MTVSFTTEQADYIEKALRDADAAILRLQAENEALRKDAERLDYIAGNARRDPKIDGQHVWWPTSFNHRLAGPTLRDAIDAAMKK